MGVIKAAYPSSMESGKIIDDEDGKILMLSSREKSNKIKEEEQQTQSKAKIMKSIEDNLLVENNSAA